MEADLTRVIREAIKEKLIELDAYVDNELPEYIMVMVANKKSKECMEKDLTLFLGKNTSAFTSWLLETLEKMEDEATLQLANGADSASFKNDYNGCASVDEANGAEDEILLDTDVLEDDLLSNELHDEAAVLNKLIRSGKDSMPESLKKEESDRKVAFKQKYTHDKATSDKVNQWSPDEKNKVEQYDPLNPAVKSVASMVQVNERKSSVPLSLQANKLLLLKAVDDANKSIVGKQNINEIYKPTPIKVLTSPSKENPTSISTKRNFILTNSPEFDDYVPRKRFAIESQDNKTICHRNRPNLLQIIPQPDIEMYSPEPLHRTFHIASDDVHMTELSYERDSSPTNVRSTISPNFVVTLNGVDENTFRKKLMDDLSESSDTENVCTENFENSPESTSPNEKSSEKCRFWPSCKNGDKCTYVHPTVPCKAFPNCTFGDKCLFIHPTCKFDSMCSREDCPYTHSHKNSKVFAVSGTPLGKFPLLSESSKTILCKYHPYCTNYHCPYAHPKKCRFGSRCRSTSCPFTHPSFPSRSQLTWKTAT